MLAAPELSSSNTLPTAGYFRLNWSAPTSANNQNQYELQRADNPSFTQAKTVYIGPDEATVISGLPDKHYFYRVRMVDTNEWSQPVGVEVKHHPLGRAFGFFALGAIMFVIMIAVLIKGALKRQTVWAYST